MSAVVIALIAGYFIGAIPFGVIIARAHGVDLANVGSGNIGATNVIRALGAKWGIFVFVLDMLKGLMPGLIARATIHAPVGGLDAQTWWFLAGLAAVAGHSKSPFLRFKGGKGVSTALGAGIAAAPAVALSAFALFILLLAVTRYMSLASMVAIAMTGVFGATFPGESRQLVPLYIALAVLIVVLHKKNIGRLMDGTEPKFEFRKSASTPDAEQNASVPVASSKEAS